MKTSTVHIHSELAQIIDKYVEQMEYSTRADFVLHAMRHAAIVYAQKKKIMVEKYLKEKPLDNNQLDGFYRSITEAYLTSYDSYSGESIQINIRIPEGLEKKLEPLIKNRYGFKRRSDYIKVSIICLCTELKECECIFKDTEKLINEEEALIESIYNGMIAGLLDKKPGKQILEEAYEILKKKRTLCRCVHSHVKKDAVITRDLINSYMTIGACSIKMNLNLFQ